MDPTAADRPLRMIRVYLQHRQIGDGYRTAFVTRETATKASLYIPSLVAALDVERAQADRAEPIAYRPRVIRHHLIHRVRLMRRHGHRVPRQATVVVLQRLGASARTVDAVIETPARPEVIAERARRLERAERTAELRDARAFIRERVERQLIEAPSGDPRRRSRRRRSAPHPDQLALAL